ncbi:YdeI/OmpD-associated family protein [Mucilaginibacter antarcticus]|uniref:YdeI/OmpD-associated family protein n=1 Tax=Mucilaginibacter antarcticus TaxID=1855725 RepID=UPI0036276149
MAQMARKNHATKQSVWVVMYKKASEKPSISWTDAVDEAICFGWIDSLKKSVDSESSVQFLAGGNLRAHGQRSIKTKWKSLLTKD